MNDFNIAAGSTEYKGFFKTYFVHQTFITLIWNKSLSVIWDREYIGMNIKIQIELEMS